jgi:putative acetyltransferase
MSIPSGKHVVANARWTGSSFRDVCLGEATFEDVNLRAAAFRDVNLAGARFEDVNLAGVAVSNANVEGMRIDGILVTDLFAAYRRKGSGPTVLVELVEAPTDDARALIGELDAELGAAYAPENRHGLSIERVFRPGVLFFVARVEGEAVGCGGVAFEDDFAEVKRMYVRPEARGRGVARAILARLEQEARARGVERLALETGDAQRAAIRLYERAGFARCGAFGVYAGMPPVAVARCVFFEKRVG